MAGTRLKTVCAMLCALVLAGEAAATPCGGPGDSIEYGCVYSDPEVQNREEIKWSLRMRQTAWRRGDTGLFMLRYWKSDALRFARGGTVVRGWPAVRDRVIKRFENRGKPGAMTFAEPDIRLLGSGAALVFERWRLERGQSVTNVLSTLLFRKINGKWLIIHDHTSSE